MEAKGEGGSKLHRDKEGALEKLCPAPEDYTCSLLRGRHRKAPVPLRAGAPGGEDTEAASEMEGRKVSSEREGKKGLLVRASVRLGRCQSPQLAARCPAGPPSPGGAAQTQTHLPQRAWMELPA